MDKIIINHPTIIRIILISSLVMKSLKIRYANMAPMGSAKPDINVCLMAFNLLLVA